MEQILRIGMLRRTWRFAPQPPEYRLFGRLALAAIGGATVEIGRDIIETGGAIAMAIQAGLLKFGGVDGVMNLCHEMRLGTVLGKLIGAGATLASRVPGVKWMLKEPSPPRQALFDVPEEEI